MSETWPSLLATLGIAIFGSVGAWAYIKLIEAIKAHLRR